MNSFGKKIEFYKVCDNKVMVTEIRPVKCLYSINEDKTIKTTQWMEVEHWLELEELIEKILKDYQETLKSFVIFGKKGIEHNVMQEKKGKNIKIGFYFEKYKSCGCTLMVPRQYNDDNSDSEVNENPETLIDKGGRFKRINYCNESLVVSVCPIIKNHYESRLKLSFKSSSPIRMDRKIKESLGIPCNDQLNSVSQYFISQSTDSVLKLRKKKTSKIKLKVLRGGGAPVERVKSVFDTESSSQEGNELSDNTITNVMSEEENVQNFDNSSGCNEYVQNFGGCINMFKADEEHVDNFDSSNGSNNLFKNEEEYGQKFNILSRTNNVFNSEENYVQKCSSSSSSNDVLKTEEYVHKCDHLNDTNNVFKTKEENVQNSDSSNNYAPNPKDDYVQNTSQSDFNEESSPPTRRLRKRQAFNYEELSGDETIDSINKNIKNKKLKKSGQLSKISKKGKKKNYKKFTSYELPDLLSFSPIPPLDNNDYANSPNNNADIKYSDNADAKSCDNNAHIKSPDDNATTKCSDSHDSKDHKEKYSHNLDDYKPWICDQNEIFRNNNLDSSNEKNKKLNKKYLRKKKKYDQDIPKEYNHSSESHCTMTSDESFTDNKKRKKNKADKKTVTYNRSPNNKLSNENVKYNNSSPAKCDKNVNLKKSFKRTKKKPKVNAALKQSTNVKKSVKKSSKILIDSQNIKSPVPDCSPEFITPESKRILRSASKSSNFSSTDSNSDSPAKCDKNVNLKKSFKRTKKNNAAIKLSTNVKKIDSQDIKNPVPNCSPEVITTKSERIIRSASKRSNFSSTDSNSDYNYKKRRVKKKLDNFEGKVTDLEDKLTKTEDQLTNCEDKEFENICTKLGERKESIDLFSEYEPLCSGEPTTSKYRQSISSLDAYIEEERKKFLTKEYDEDIRAFLDNFPSVGSVLDNDNLSELKSSEVNASINSEKEKFSDSVVYEYSNYAAVTHKDFLPTLQQLITNLTLEDLKRKFEENLDYLWKIAKQEIYTKRNYVFQLGYSSRRMDCAHYVFFYDEEVFTELCEIMTTEFKDQIKKNHLGVGPAYVFYVMIPELLKKILMDMPFVQEHGGITDEQCEDAYFDLFLKMSRDKPPAKI